MKQVIKDTKGFDVNSMVLSYEKVILMDSQELEGKSLSQRLPPTGDKRANQIEEEKPIIFLLTLA